MNRSTTLGWPLAAAGAALAFAGAFSTSPATAAPAPRAGDIVDTAAMTGRFDTLLAAATVAGLVPTLKSPGPFTVFAPYDPAFAKLDPFRLNALLDPANKGALTSVLTFHVVPGVFNAAQVVGLDALDTVQGQRLTVEVQGPDVLIDGKRLIAVDIPASNGVIHVLEDVMLPNFKNIPLTAQGAGVFDTLLTAVNAADLVNLLSAPGPYTVFAPTDAAFGKLPPGTVQSLLLPQNKQQLIDVLSFHVVPSKAYADQVVGKGPIASLLAGKTVEVLQVGQSLQVNGVNISATDIDASNGVIHVIDEVLLP